MSYTEFSDVHCEICSSVYPKKVAYKGKNIDLIEQSVDYSKSFFQIEVLDTEDT